VVTMSLMVSMHMDAEEKMRREVAGGSLINFQEGHGLIVHPGPCSGPG